MDDGAGIERLEFQGGMQGRGGRAADHDRGFQAAAFEFGNGARHFVERGRDESAEADEIGVFTLGGVCDLVGGDHDAEVVDRAVVALEHDRHDVLADVMDIALHRGKHADGAGRGGRGGLCGLDHGHQDGHGTLHHAGGLHDLRQEHPARAEQFAGLPHAVHERALDDRHRVGIRREGFGHIGIDEGVISAHEGGGDAFRERERTPFRGSLRIGFRGGSGGVLHGCGEFEEAFPRAGRGVEHDGLGGVAEFGGQHVVIAELGGVHDAHGQAGVDGVLEEDGVDRAADEVVSAERERNVADAAADAAEREKPVQFGDGTDEVGGVVVVPGDARGDGKHVRVQHDVLLRESGLLGQEPHGSRERFDATVEAVGLSALVERHDEDGRAETADLARLRQERLLAFLEGNRVHDAAPLHTAESGADDLPVRGVDHERDGSDVGFARGIEQETFHGGGRVEQGVVHIDVDDGRAVFDLVARDRHGAGHVVGPDDVQELAGSGHVGAFADIDEVLVAGRGEGVEAGETQETRTGWRDARLHAVKRSGDGRDVGGRRAAAAARDVELSGIGQRTDDGGHLVRGLRVVPFDVGQSGVGVRADQERRFRGHFGDVRA